MSRVRFTLMVGLVVLGLGLPTSVLLSSAPHRAPRSGASRKLSARPRGERQNHQRGVVIHPGKHKPSAKHHTNTTHTVPPNTRNPGGKNTLTATAGTTHKGVTPTGRTPKGRAPKGTAAAGGKKPRAPLRGQDRKDMERFRDANIGKLTPPQTQAVNNVLSGAPLSGADRDAINGLLAGGGVNGQSVNIPPNVRDLLAQAVQEDTDQNLRPWRQRILRVHNDTKEPLKVFVQYHTLDKRNGWTWIPATPGQSKRAAAFVVRPGAVINLKDGDRVVRADQVRIWARSPSEKEWAAYQNEELWLVPEMEGREHLYRAVDEETWPVTFRADSASERTGSR